MKIPGPDHPITIAPHPKRLRVLHQGHVIGETTEALVLTESTYKPVIYFPRDDIAIEYMARTDHSTHCPYKGDASYYSLLMDGALAENTAWSYEDPFPAMEQIRGHLAFYPDQVEIRQVDETKDGKAGAVDVNEVILHTDSGSGQSQKEHWPPTVDTPEG